MKPFIKRFGIDILAGAILALFIILMMAFSAKAQNVGINNLAPHLKSLLDLTSTDKGLLTPRMTQVQRIAMFPVTDATAKGMLVYQTDNTQGFYYYDGATWQLLNNGANGWGVTGNAGTSPSTNFLGTTDNNDVAIKTNNQEWMRFTATKKVGIGATTFSNPSARVEISDEDGSNSDFAMRVAGVGYPDFTFVKNRGTLATPLVTQAGDVNGVISNWAHDGTKYLLSSRISFLIDSNTAVNDVAGSIRFYTSNNNLTPEAMRISSNGNVGIGNGNPLQKLDVIGNVNIVADSNYRINNVRVLSVKGISNLFAGSNAGINNGTGGYNTFVGTYSGLSNTLGGSNAFFGQSSGRYNTTGTFNTFIGNNSGFNNTTAVANVYLGTHTGFNNTAGSYNVYIGANAGYNSTDSNNVFVGTSSGVSNNVGRSNSFFGTQSGYHNTTGNNNTMLGFFAGYGNSTGSNNTYLGYMARGAGNITNSGAVGYNAYVASSNSIVLGDTGVNVGINNSSPFYPLCFRNTHGDKICFWGGAGNHYGIGIQSSLLQIHAASSIDDIAFGIGSSNSFVEKMRIKGNGKVGIGTSTPGVLFPSSILEIADSTGVSKDVVIRTSNNTNLWQVLAFVRTRGTYSAPALVQNNDNLGRVSGVGYDGVAALTAAEIQFHVDSIASANNMPGNITFNTTPANSGTNCLERMRIDRNGNIGINTGAPTAKLHINGSFKICDGTQGAGKVLTSDAAGLTSWQTITAASLNAWSNTGNSGTNAATNFIGTTDANDLSIRTNNLTRLTVTSAGNLGIGSTTPQTRAEINGGLSLLADVSLTANSANFNITVGDRSYIRLNSNSTPANRLISLSNGLQVGQILMIECSAPGGVNGIRMSDTPATYNTNLATFHDMYENDMITLLWNGTDWIETAYTNN